MSSSLWRLPFPSARAATASIGSERRRRAGEMCRRSGEVRPGDEADASSRRVCVATDAGQGGRTRHPALCGYVRARPGPLRTAGRIRRIWAKAPHRRSRRDRSSWQRLQALADRCRPGPWIRHLWPGQRFDVKYPRQQPHGLKIMSGSVRRAPENQCPDRGLGYRTARQSILGPATNVSTCPKTSRMLAGKRRRTM